MQCLFGTISVSEPTTSRLHSHNVVDSCIKIIYYTPKDSCVLYVDCRVKLSISVDNYNIIMLFIVHVV